MIRGNRRVEQRENARDAVRVLNAQFRSGRKFAIRTGCLRARTKSVSLRWLGLIRIGDDLTLRANAPATYRRKLFSLLSVTNHREHLSGSGRKVLNI